jgi:hypothetical protein
MWRQEKMLSLDHLIFFLCARGGESSWAAAQRCIRELNPPQENQEATRSNFDALRALDMLGHCDVFGSGAKSIVRVTRPALARLPDLSVARAVLTGARSGGTVQEIQNICKTLGGGVRCVTNETRFGCNIANRIVLEADIADGLQQAAVALKIPLTSNPAAWDLVCVSKSVEDIEQTLVWQEGYPVPGDAEYFSPDTLRFEEVYDVGLRVARWKDATTGRSVYALRKDKSVAPLENSEWARHIELAASGASTLRYDATKKVFALRAIAPPPRLIARALCLCSGRPPSLLMVRQGNADIRWLRFADVPVPIAEKVSERLGQALGLLPANLAEPGK